VNARHINAKDVSVTMNGQPLKLTSEAHLVTLDFETQAVHPTEYEASWRQFKNRFGSLGVTDTPIRYHHPPARRDPSAPMRIVRPLRFLENNRVPNRLLQEARRAAARGRGAHVRYLAEQFAGYVR